MLLFNDVFLLCKKKESAFKLMELIELHSITLDSSCGFLDASDGDILGDIPQLQFCVSAFSPFGFRREKRSMEAFWLRLPAGSWPRWAGSECRVRPARLASGDRGREGCCGTAPCIRERVRERRKQRLPHDQAKGVCTGFSSGVCQARFDIKEANLRGCQAKAEHSLG